MVRAANEFSVQLEAIFQALYPFQPESRTFLVTSINPEAGRHPVPADARELEAALRAADLCWERFPAEWITAVETTLSRAQKQL